MKQMPSELSEPSEPSEISEPFMEETQRTPEEAPRGEHDLRGCQGIARAVGSF